MGWGGVRACPKVLGIFNAKKVRFLTLDGVYTPTRSGSAAGVVALHWPTMRKLVNAFR